MDLKTIPAWRWFWGAEKQPTAEEAFRLLEDADALITDKSGLAMLVYDRKNLVATLHLYIEPEARNSRSVAEKILAAERIASIDGMRKILAPLTEGNPFLRGGKHKKFGYELEGVLKNQILIDGKSYSLFLYSKLLLADS